MRSANPGAKAVVFSAWTRVLRLVASALSVNNIPSVSLTGAAAGGADARADAVAKFQSDPSVKVILILMTTGGECLENGQCLGIGRWVRARLLCGERADEVTKCTAKGKL